MAGEMRIDKNFAQLYFKDSGVTCEQIDELRHVQDALSLIPSGKMSEDQKDAFLDSYYRQNIVPDPLTVKKRKEEEETVEGVKKFIIEQMEAQLNSIKQAKEATFKKEKNILSRVADFIMGDYIVVDEGMQHAPFTTKLGTDQATVESSISGMQYTFNQLKKAYEEKNNEKFDSVYRQITGHALDVTLYQKLYELKKQHDELSAPSMCAPGSEFAKKWKNLPNIEKELEQTYVSLIGKNVAAETLSKHIKDMKVASIGLKTAATAAVIIGTWGASLPAQAATFGTFETSMDLAENINGIDDLTLHNLSGATLKGFGTGVTFYGIGKGIEYTTKGIGSIYTGIKNARAGARSDMLNIPVIANPDAEVISEIAGSLKDIEMLAAETSTESASAIIRALTSLGNTVKSDAVNILNGAKNKTKALHSKLASSSQKIKQTRVYKALGNLPEKVKSTISLDKLKAKTALRAIRSAEESGLADNAAILSERLGKLMSSPEFLLMSKEQQIQKMMEEVNILFPKFAQTFSGNPSLPENIQKIFKQFVSNCPVSRTLEQAQTLADNMYGAGKYTLKKSLGAGTIGETYLAETAEGKDVVVKMIKEGITPERFEQDRSLFVNYINKFFTNEEREYRLKLVNGMFDAWKKELDLSIEAQGARSMAASAKRFKVVSPIEVGTLNGQNISLVMEKADGVPLDKLIEMIKQYKADPAVYAQKYADLIKSYPALENPDKWMDLLPKVYQRAQNEQAMFVAKNGIRTIHADPHPGNVFVNFGKKGKPEITYIDTGNVIDRSSKETLRDISLALNTVVGNSKGIAETIVERAVIPAGANKKQIVEEFTKLLDERLFKAHINLTNPQYANTVINDIMRKLNIIIDSSDANLLKATLQREETLKELANVCGTSVHRRVDLKDLVQGLMRSTGQHPIETWKTLKPIISWIYNNQDQAMRTVFQAIQ